MEIRFLLEKYKNLGFSEKRIKELTLEICEQYKLILTSDDVSIKQTEVKINVSGSARAHFVLVKKLLEQSLQEALAKEGLKVSKIY